MTETPQPPREPEPEATPPAPPPPSAPTPVPAEAADYPLQANIERQDEYSRLLPLVKWLLAIPHYIVLFFLGIGALLAIIVSWFAVIFTRRYPRGLFDYVVGVQRWGWRVNAYVQLMTDWYPPFSLRVEPGFPAPFEIAYPEEGVDRWRPLVAWLLAIPYLIVAGVLVFVASILVFLAFFAILFTKRFPESFFGFVLTAQRWQARGNAYANWLVTKYPPWVMA